MKQAELLARLQKKVEYIYLPAEDQDCAFRIYKMLKTNDLGEFIRGLNEDLELDAPDTIEFILNEVIDDPPLIGLGKIPKTYEAM